MKRFLGKIICVLIGVVIIGLVPMLQSLRNYWAEFDVIYRIKPEDQILCVGSSTIRSSLLVDEEKYKNKRIWLHSSDSAAILARILTLERLNMLENIRYCVVDINPGCVVGPLSKSIPLKEDIWLREFPINWRYPHLRPVYFSSYVSSLIGYICGIIRGVGKFEVSGDLNAKEMADVAASPAFLDRSAKWQEETLLHYKNLHYSGWELRPDETQRRFSNYADMKAVCDRNGVIFIVFSPPLLSSYRAIIPNEILSRYNDLLMRLGNDGITVYDKRDAYPDSLFRDPIHLSFAGTERFSAEFFHWLKDHKN